MGSDHFGCKWLPVHYVLTLTVWAMGGDPLFACVSLFPWFVPRWLQILYCSI